MKQRVARLSPHQNAKVMAIMSAVTSLILAVPLLLLASTFNGGHGAPLWGIIVFPVVYLVVGYVFTVIACAIYNLLVPLTGGIEYDVTPGA